MAQLKQEEEAADRLSKSLSHDRCPLVTFTTHLIDIYVHSFCETYRMKYGWRKKGLLLQRSKRNGAANILQPRQLS